MSMKLMNHPYENVRGEVRATAPDLHMGYNEGSQYWWSIFYL